jgi:hypothetical protein
MAGVGRHRPGYHLGHPKGLHQWYHRDPSASELPVRTADLFHLQDEIGW